MVFDHEDDYDSQWAAIRVVAQQIGCSTEGLRRWVRQSETDQGRRRGLASSEREQLIELEREVRELRRANSGLSQSSKSSGYAARIRLYAGQPRRLPTTTRIRTYTLTTAT